MDKVLVPLGIFVALPVMIVWLVTRARQNEINRKTELLLKAMESGAQIDTNLIASPIGGKTIKERLLKRLTAGCIFTLMGIVFLTIGIVNGINLQPGMSNDSAVIPSVFGGIWLAIGVSFFIVFFVGRKMLAKEISAEEKTLTRE
ncbi:MAG: hypothetical protein IKW20_06970 [Bacteroidales bacterium]|nr:hypothetical protein [Bacteroidales bacterium]MBR5833992.1 hypothetical protein [Bacteroidales bacterium]